MIRSDFVTRRLAAAFALPAVLLAACGGEPAVDPNAPFAVIDSGLSTPESVLWDAGRSVWYVSNINGSATEKDDNGYILRLGANGEAIDSLPFVNGADDDITLNAPKGLALVGDTLWVADIDAVRGFDVTTGTAVASVELRAMGATFLNDVAAAADGTLYITDSGIAFDESGNVSHPGRSRVFALRGRSATEAVRLPDQTAPNGIAWDAGRNAWLIVGFNSPNVFAWTTGATSADILGTGPGGADGIVLLSDGRALYTSWADSSLTIFENGTSTTLRKGFPSPADLGYDPARGLVAVPNFAGNRIEFWHVM